MNDYDIIILVYFFVKKLIEATKDEEIAHHRQLHFLLVTNPVPLLYLWSITQMCCQKLLYALTLVEWVDSTHGGSQWRSH